LGNGTAQLVGIPLDRPPADSDRWPLADGPVPLRAGPYRGLTCEAPNLWCPVVPLEMVHTRGGGRVRLPLYPSMEVHAGLATGAGERLPTAGTVQGVVSGTTLELSTAVTPLEGKLSFVAPRAELDLRFSFPGYVPVYRWGVAPAPAPTALGLAPLRLRRGGSVAGWLRRSDDELPVASARLRLASLSAGPDSSPSPLQHPRVQETDPSGFFQFSGLAEGQYRLVAEAPSLAPLDMGVIHVEADAETFLGAVPMDRALSLGVRLEPPVHPSGRRWSVEARPERAAGADGRIAVTTAVDGRAVLSPLRSGRHVITVSAGDLGRFYSETIDVASEEIVELAIPVVAVTGSVRLGDDPIAASVELTTGAGDAVTLSSDDSGELFGWMRRPSVD
jgi:hypothetical protein